MSLNKHSDHRKLTGMLLMLSLLITTSGALAAGAVDFKQQLIATADIQELDLKSNQVTFTGNVKVTQGSIVILADRLIVERTADGSAIERMLAYGDLAHYEQITEDGTPISADGKVLDYRMRQQLLIIDGNARVTQRNNEITGKRIRYDLAKEQLRAESDSGNAQDRVTTIFQPNDDDED